MNKFIFIGIISAVILVSGCAPRASFPETTVEQVKVINVTTLDQFEKIKEYLKNKGIVFDKMTNGQCAYVSTTFELNGEKYSLRVDCKDASNWRKRLKNALHALSE